MKIYTDGSAHPNPGPGGFGIVVFDDNYNYLKSLSEQVQYTTNNEMELKAILFALKLFGAQANQDFIQPPTVYTDSAYAYNIYTNWMYNWAKNDWLKADGKKPENLEIIKDYFNESKNKIIDLRKIAGHSNILGNELADKLATGKLHPADLQERYIKNE